MCSGQQLQGGRRDAHQPVPLPEELQQPGAPGERISWPRCAVAALLSPVPPHGHVLAWSSAGSCSFACPGPQAKPCACSMFEDAMSSRHEAGRGRAGPWGAHQLQALGSSRGSGVLHPLPHSHVQSNPNPSGAHGEPWAPPTSVAGGAEPRCCAGPAFLAAVSPPVLFAGCSPVC